MKEQFYKVEIIVETEGKEIVNLKDIQQLEKDSKVYSIDITPIDIDNDQFEWVKALKTLNEF
jgi:hypothetical protein